MNIESLMPEYEMAMSEGNDEKSSEIYSKMIDIYMSTMDTNIIADSEEDELMGMIADGISSIFSSFYLEKMVKQNYLDVLVEEDGTFSYKVLPKGRLYLKKLSDIYGEDVIRYN